MKRNISNPSRRKSHKDGINYHPVAHEKYFSQDTEIMTPDGPGKTIGINMRKNTNGGPGVRQYVVRLADGRIRHYATSDVKEL
jgi:hypothetical protein